MRLRSLLKPLAYLAGCLLYAIPDWLTDEFGSVSIDQVLYHLSFGTDGLLKSDPALMHRFLLRGLALPLGVALLLWGADTYITHLREHGREATRQRIEAFLRRLRNIGASLRGWALKLGMTVFRRGLPLAVLGFGTLYFIDSFSLVSFVRSFYGPDFFAGSYVDPARVSLHKDHPKNLVLIYVESLENTYSDPALFGRDLLARLTALKSRGISFDDYQQLMGAHYTIAGMVSTQCGVPLKALAMFGGNEQGEKVARFLPKARCLGDILAKEGYLNVFLNGSSLEFAGVGRFLHDHHYAKLVGREEWLGMGEKQETMSGWGLHDDDLFRRARGELGALMRAGRPFNLTILTIDTHHPYGHLSTRCAQQGYTDFEGIVECTAAQVADFVEYIEKNGWLDKVAVVVQGDHLAMGNTSYDKLIRNPRRTVFNLLLGARAGMTKNTDSVSHFDMLPTILTLMGFEVRGERAGLGYAAIGPALVARAPDRLEAMGQQLMNYSAAYRELWQSDDGATNPFVADPAAAPPASVVAAGTQGAAAGGPNASPSKPGHP